MVSWRGKDIELRTVALRRNGRRIGGANRHRAAQLPEPGLLGLPIKAMQNKVIEHFVDTAGVAALPQEPQYDREGVQGLS